MLTFSLVPAILGLAALTSATPHDLAARVPGDYGSDTTWPSVTVTTPATQPSASWGAAPADYNPDDWECDDDESTTVPTSTPTGAWGDADNQSWGPYGGQGGATATADEWSATATGESGSGAWGSGSGAWGSGSEPSTVTTGTGGSWATGGSWGTGAAASGQAGAWSATASVATGTASAAWGASASWSASPVAASGSWGASNSSYSSSTGAWASPAVEWSNDASAKSGSVFGLFGAVLATAMLFL